jgi:hypothetical protein
VRSIPPAVLDASVRGVNLMPGSLRDQLGDETTLLVFLRYFGCGFCREMIAGLREIREGAADFPPVLFVFQGSPMEGRAFLRRYWPSVRAVSDPQLQLYEAFGVRRGRVLELFGPGVWSARRRAIEAGHRNGERSGDLWRMPGVFLVRDDAVLWAHEFQHAGDLPDFAGIPERARVLA